tara:strand:+ start:61 stop:432 length:372 start_codon:yes stop_codon:yes gene_type:complete
MVIIYALLKLTRRMKKIILRTTGSSAMSFVPAKISSKGKPGATTGTITTTTAPLIVTILIVEQNAVKDVMMTVMTHAIAKRPTVSSPAIKTMANASNASLQITVHAQSPTLFAQNKTLANAMR